MIIEEYTREAARMKAKNDFFTAATLYVQLADALLEKQNLENAANALIEAATCYSHFSPNKTEHAFRAAIYTLQKVQRSDLAAKCASNAGNLYFMLSPPPIGIQPAIDFLRIACELAQMCGLTMLYASCADSLDVLLAKQHAAKNNA